MSTNAPSSPSLERLTLAIEQSPWDAIYRVVLGIAMLAAMAWIAGDDASIADLLAALLTVLIGLRLGPAVLRSVWKASPATRDQWAERRRLAKRFDSYQWQKLFWLGVGFAAYAAWPDHATRARLTVAALCLIPGAIGLVVWRRAQILPPDSPPPIQGRPERGFA